MREGQLVRMATPLKKNSPASDRNLNRILAEIRIKSSLNRKGIPGKAIEEAFEFYRIKVMGETDRLLDNLRIKNYREIFPYVIEAIGLAGAGNAHKELIINGKDPMEYLDELYQRH